MKICFKKKKRKKRKTFLQALIIRRKKLLATFEEIRGGAVIESLKQIRLQELCFLSSVGTVGIPDGHRIVLSTHRCWCKPVRILIHFKVKEKALSAISCLFMVIFIYTLKPVSFYWRTSQLTIETLDTQYCFCLGGPEPNQASTDISMQNKTPEGY